MAKMPGKRTREKMSIFLAANLKSWNQAEILLSGNLETKVILVNNFKK